MGLTDGCYEDDARGRGTMRRIGMSMGLALMLAGCAGNAALPTVQLSDLQPLPAAEPGQVMPLKVAVAAVTSPQGTAESYQPLLDDLADRLDRPIQLVQRSGQ
jgi:uncharacterized lipoprotein YmbA